jgi:hypothetical protein
VNGSVRFRKCPRITSARKMITSVRRSRLTNRRGQAGTPDRLSCRRHQDLSSRSRTQDPGSRSPAASTAPRNSGQEFAAATRRGAGRRTPRRLRACNRPLPAPSPIHTSGVFRPPPLSNRMPQLGKTVNAPMPGSPRFFASSPDRPWVKKFRQKVSAALLLRAGAGATAAIASTLTGKKPGPGRVSGAKTAGFGAESGPFLPILGPFSAATRTGLERSGEAGSRCGRALPDGSHGGRPPEENPGPISASRS